MSVADIDTLTEKFSGHQRELCTASLSSLFSGDAARARTFSLRAAGLLLDYSKNFCTPTTLQLFEELAAAIDLPGQIEAMFSGAVINTTEQRPVLHTALRAGAADAPMHAEVRAVQARMQRLVEALGSGERRGFSGQPITDVINIGIGGSDLGPRFVTAALRAWHRPGLRAHFVANIDPVELADTLRGLNPATTLIITASKSFTTLETRANSLAARAWLQAAAGGRAITDQLVAITANPQRAAEFGIAADNIYPMWDWVGGRYSLWSAIGLPIAVACGWEPFAALLRGAEAMDTHYRSAPLRANMPALLAMLECWYSGYWQAHSVAVLPYAQRLQRFPAFLQQLSMESLGKSVDRAGQPLHQPSGAVIWGEPGSNSQHSFMQLVHQGTRFIPVDFIAVAVGEDPGNGQHTQLFANCLSQSRALMTGKSRDQVLAELRAAGMAEAEAQALAPHKVLPGNRPSNTILLESLTPASLGALIALYEHKVHAQGAIWNIDAFDQWGVELGKQSAGIIADALGGGAQPELDGSTAQLVQNFRQLHPE